MIHEVLVECNLLRGWPIVRKCDMYMYVCMPSKDFEFNWCSLHEMLRTSKKLLAGPDMRHKSCLVLPEIDSLDSFDLSAVERSKDQSDQQQPAQQQHTPYLRTCT
jgi:hypothetical protein